MDDVYVLLNVLMMLINDLVWNNLNVLVVYDRIDNMLSCNVFFYISIRNTFNLFNYHRLKMVLAKIGID